jgi:phage shock protein PspC (stress-responsive transcriptional regulator)
LLVVAGVTYAGLAAYYILAQTQIRPVFIAASVLGLAGLLLFLIGFIAELIVSQSEQIREMEYRMMNDER